jgi:hypothetical protein
MVVFMLFSVQAEAKPFLKGFNQAWLENNYGTQWLDQTYDKESAKKLIQTARQAHAGILRMWLYEGASLQQFNLLPSGAPESIKTEVLANLRNFLSLCRTAHLKVNLTFLDGNAFKQSDAYATALPYWRSIFEGDQPRLSAFYRVAIAPVYRLIKEEYSDVITQVDLVNEVNALQSDQAFPHLSHLGLLNFLCRLKSKSPVPTTASLGWDDGARRLLRGYFLGSCLDFFDIHVYNDEGKIPACPEFQILAFLGVKFQLGEFGQKSTRIDPKLQAKITGEFLTNARRCGFQSALAWRLNEVRSIGDVDLRFGYVTSAGESPALKVFREFKPASP